MLGCKHIILSDDVLSESVSRYMDIEYCSQTDGFMSPV